MTARTSLAKEVLASGQSTITYTPPSPSSSLQKAKKKLIPSPGLEITLTH